MKGKFEWKLTVNGKKITSKFELTDSEFEESVTSFYAKVREDIEKKFEGIFSSGKSEK